MQQFSNTKIDFAPACVLGTK